MISAVCQDGMQKQIKNKKNCLFAECNGPLHSAKGLFAECHGPLHSAKLGRVPACCLIPSFAECQGGGTRQRIFQKKNSFLCRVPLRAALGKEFFLKKINFFAECPPGGHSAKNFFKKN
jgi:hypothetical protein